MFAYSKDYGTKRFNAVFIKALQESLSWAESTKFQELRDICTKFITEFSFHLPLDLPEFLFPVGFLTPCLMEPGG